MSVVRKEVVIRKTYKEIRCQRCKHVWLYGGKSEYFCSCPKCRSSVSLHPKRKKESKISEDDFLKDILE